jgi:hypothetical protein
MAWAGREMIASQGVQSFLSQPVFSLGIRADRKLPAFVKEPEAIIGSLQGNRNADGGYSLGARFESA